MTGSHTIKLLGVLFAIVIFAISFVGPASVLADPSEDNAKPDDNDVMPIDGAEPNDDVMPIDDIMPIDDLEPIDEVEPIDGPAEEGFDEVEAPEPEEVEIELTEWTAPTEAEVRAQLVEWIESQTTDEEVIEAALAEWPEADPNAEESPVEPTETEMLDRLVASFAAVDADASDLTRLCRSTVRIAPSLPEWLADESRSSFLIENMRLLVGRWMVHNNLYDEAGKQMAGMVPQEVVAPGTLLFFQSVVHHRLLESKVGLQRIEHLLMEEDDIPRRYAAVARLMQDDLQVLKDDSLDHIARRMGDIKRRMDLGRAGPRVREIEDGVIDSLDKMIEELEKQQQQQSSSSSGGNQLQPSSPAQDSQIMGGNGPGNVTRRNIGSGADWGDLPPQQREEALQQIGQDFPSHYRDVIEQYFRRLAAEKVQ